MTQENPNDLSARLLRYLYRMNQKRLDAETFRDSVLQISGRLDLTMGGPGIKQFVERKGPQATPSLNYYEYDWSKPEAARRSIYRVVWRGIQDPFMEALDFPDMALLASKRENSVSPLQSLVLYNNKFVLYHCQVTAERLKKESNDLNQQVSRAVNLIWLRNPTQQEQSMFSQYAAKHGLEALCRVLLNSNEFLMVD